MLSGYKKNLLVMIIAVVFVIVSVYLIIRGYQTLSATFEASQEVLSVQHQRQHELMKMYGAARERSVVLLEMSVQNDAFALDDLRQKMRDLAVVFIKARHRLQKINHTDAHWTQLDAKLGKMVAENSVLQNHVADLFAEGKNQRAEIFMINKVVVNQTDILAAISLMGQAAEKNITRMTHLLNTQFYNAQHDFRLVAIIALSVFVMAFAFLLIQLFRGENVLANLLQLSEIRYETIVDNIKDGIISMDEKCVISSFNHSAEKIFGYTEKEIAGKSIKKLIDKDSYMLLDAYIKNIPEQKSTTEIELNAIRRNGTRLILSIALTDTCIHGGQRFSGILRDITAQKKSQDELAKASKLESVGVLAGGIAHDFNNLLAGIMGNIEMAMRCLTDTDKVKRYLQTSSRACQRAAGLTQQLLTFSKGGEPVKKNADIIEVIRESTEFSLHGSNINYHFEKPQGQCLVSIDSGQISQVIQNLIINARHAMPDGGDIFIRCERVSRIAEMPAPDSAASKQLYIKISVEDTGTGIDEKDLESIFDPYFTTRKSGSGLGLALSYSIMQKHQGYIFVHSTPGLGSCFTLYLPEVRSQQAYRNEVAKVIEKSTTHKRIMLMDDDEMIREIGEAMLEDLGYEVVQAENGEQAIEKYKIAQQHNNPIDCIIMDLTIPGGMGGKEAIIEVLKINPQAKAIVSSGYSSDPIMANYTDYGFKNAISKPYNLDELSIALSAVFSAD